MDNYASRIQWLADRRLTDPARPVLDVPGPVPSAAFEPQFPISRSDFHAMPDALASVVSWDNGATGARETWRVAYSGHFGWSVVRDIVGGKARFGDWYGAVVTSPRTYAGCVAYLTLCIAPGRWWAGDNLTVDEIV